MRLFSRSLRARERVRGGDVRLQGEFNTGRFVEFFSSFPPFMFPFSERSGMKNGYSNGDS